jgi:hypothetical protein
LSLRALWPSALLWVGVGGWAFERLAPDGRAGGLLALGWWVLLMAGRWRHGAGACCPSPWPRGSDLAMGAMMGTLWWHADTCLAGAGPALLWVALHLGLMTAPFCVARSMRRRLSRHWNDGWGLGLWLLVLALSLCAPDQPGAALGLMAALSLAWALEPTRLRAPAQPHAVRWDLNLALLAGPIGLWALHQAWPTQGPTALFHGLAGLAGLAALAALAHLRAALKPSTATAHKRHRPGLAHRLTTGDSQ